MKKLAKKEKQTVSIQVGILRKHATEVTVIGDSPLIVHAWSQKAKLEMLGKQMGLASIREHKDPWEQFLGCLYTLKDDAGYGFPVVAVKEAMATAAVEMEGLSKAAIYRNIFIKGVEGFEKSAFMDLLSSRELAPIYSPTAPRIREDMVRLSGIGRTPDIRYRAEFYPWAMRFQLSYCDGILSPDSIMNLLAHAGFQVGLGEYRQEKGGTYGAFHMADAMEMKQTDRWIKQGPGKLERPDIEGWTGGLREQLASPKERKLKVVKS